MAFTVAEVTGSLGVFLLLVAFFLNIFGLLAASSRLYQVLNLAGAGLSCYASYRLGFVPFVVLEGTWSLVAAVALVRSPTSVPLQ